MASSEVVAQLWGLRIEALGPKLLRRQAETDGHINRDHPCPQAIYDPLCLGRERLPMLLVLQGEPNGSKQAQVLGPGVVVRLFGDGPKPAGKVEQSLTLDLLHFFHPLLKQDMIGMPGGIRGDERRQGLANGAFLGWLLFDLRALDIRLKYLLESRVGDHEAVLGEYFSCPR